MKYQIIPIFLGSIIEDRADSLYMYPRGKMIRLAYSCFVLKSETKTIMVDTGLPSQEDIRKNGKPFRLMDDAVNLKDALAKVGIDPLDVSTIILTHLHYDHSCNLELFPNAEIYVQKRELEYALCPLDVERRIYSILKECGEPGWIKGLSRFKRVDGDADIMPGIRVILTPGHSPGSQSVVVDTKDGIYILTGDYIPIMENFTEKIPNTLHNSLEAWYKSYDKIAQINAKLLPGHDNCVFDKEIYG